MNGCKVIAAPNLSHQAASNAGSNPLGNFPAMNATFEKRFTACPVTDTSGSIVRSRDLNAFSLAESVYP